MKPIILAIDTSTEACSAAILQAKGLLWRHQMTAKAHTTLLLPMIEDLLTETGLRLTDIQAIAVTRGPGSFTGVRIGMGIAQGMGFGLNIPVYEISTLAALAQTVGHQGRVIVALDARMHEVYTATYDCTPNAVIAYSSENLCSPTALMANAILHLEEKVLLAGSGWDTYQPTFMLPKQWQFLPQQFPHAKAVAELAYQQWLQGEKGVAADSVLPVYLRDNVAHPNKSTKMAS